jgi:hypothetical protein
VDGILPLILFCSFTLQIEKTVKEMMNEVVGFNRTKLEKKKEGSGFMCL